MSDSRSRTSVWGVEIRTLATVALVVTAMTLAGCSALPGSETPTPTSSGEPTDARAATPNTTATPASLPSLAERGIDVNATWNRTERLVGANATKPPVEVRRNVPTHGAGLDSGPFVDLLVGQASEAPLQPSAWYRSTDHVVVFHAETVRESSAAELESILAHEYAHAIQDQREWYHGGGSRMGEGERKAGLAHNEGFAEYVQREYGARYLDSVTDRERLYENASTHERYALAQYYYGSRYFDRGVEETGNLSAVAQDPPASTEQVLHDTDDAPRDLRVHTDYAAGVTIDRSTQGELATRVVLRDELSTDRAIRAAEGWGADRLLGVETSLGRTSGYVWVHRWDAVTDADEFESAMADFLDDRRSETDEYRFDLHRLTPETTVVVTGQEEFVDGTTVTAESNESVAVALPE